MPSRPAIERAAAIAASHPIARIGDQCRQARRGAKTAVRPGDGAHALGRRPIVEQDAAAAVDLQIDEPGSQRRAGRKACLRPIGRELRPRRKPDDAAVPDQHRGCRHASGDRQKPGPPGWHVDRLIDGMISKRTHQSPWRAGIVAQQIRSKLKDTGYPGRGADRGAMPDSSRRVANRYAPSRERNSMDRLIIRGGRRIEGSVQICGAKNAALPQIAAALLSAEPLELAQRSRSHRRRHHARADGGVRRDRHPGARQDAGAGRRAAPATRRRPTTWSAACAPAFWCWRRCWPGSVRRGCLCPAAARSARGRSTCISRRWRRSAPRSTSRPATFTRGPRDGGLRGGRIVLSSPSVGATETALMAAVLARGETEIFNAARDPEICRPRTLPDRDGRAHSKAPARIGFWCRAWMPAPRPPRSDHRPH